VPWQEFRLWGAIKPKPLAFEAQDRLDFREYFFLSA